MELWVERNALRRATRAIVGLLEPRWTEWPAIAGLWLEVADSKLRLRAGPDTGIEVTVPLDRATSGQTVVPCGLFSQTIQQLSPGPVHLRAEAGGTYVHSSGFEAVIASPPLERAPQPRGAVVGGRRITVDASRFTGGLRHIALTLASRYSWARPGTECIQVTVDERSARLVATDMSQLAIAEIDLETLLSTDTRSATFHVSPDALLALGRLLPTKGPIDIDIGHGQVDFIFPLGAVRAPSPPIRFPDYQPLIHRPLAAALTVSRSALRDGIERGGVLFSRVDRQPGGCLWLSLRQRRLIVRGQVPESGEGNFELDARTRGASLDIGIRYWSLFSMLSQLRGRQVVIEADRTDKPVRIYSPTQPRSRYYVLPVAQPMPPWRLQIEETLRDDLNGE